MADRKDDTGSKGVTLQRGSNYTSRKNHILVNLMSRVPTYTRRQKQGIFLLNS